MRNLEQEAGKRKEGRDHWVLILVYLLLSAILACVLGLSLTKPQNRLIPWQMAVGTLASGCLFLGFLWAWERWYGLFQKLERWNWLMLAMYGILLYGICISQGNRNHTLADYAVIYQGAMELAEGKELSFPHYFSVYTNNVKPTLFLSILFRIGRFMHLGYFQTALFFSVLTVLISMWALGVLLSQKTVALLLMAICLPSYVLTGAFYTDAMSLGWGVTALAFLKLGAGRDSRRQFLFAALAGLAAAYGMEWKMTAGIPLIAGACILFVRKEWRKKRLVGCFVFFTLLFLLLIGAWSNRYEFARNSKKTGNPLTSWFAIGMVGDGSWNESKTYVDRLYMLETKEEKNALTMSYAKEHWREAVSAEHFTRKLRRNYASGMLGSQDFLPVEDDGTFLYRLMAPWGKYYWRSSQFMFCYMGMIYLVMFWGNVASLWLLLKGEKLPPWKILADVAFLGIFMFLMLWESNNRQLYNQIPILLLGLVTNGRFLMTMRRRKESLESIKNII